MHQINKTDLPAMRPVGDKIIFEPLSEEAVTAAGIIMFAAASRKKKIGEVVAVGLGKVAGTEVAVGDFIVYSWNHVKEVKLNKEEKAYVIEASDVMAVIRKED